MSLKSAENFLLDFKASDEVGAILNSSKIKDNEINKKIDLIVVEAAKRGYHFTAIEFQDVVDEFIKMCEYDNFENITGGKGKISNIIKSMLPYYRQYGV